MSNDIDRTIAALQAIKLIRDCYASGPEGQKRTMDVLDMLAMGGHENSVRVRVANALRGF